MSNELAISGVTRTLRQLIDTAIKEAIPANLPADVQPTNQIQDVTTLPLDKARDPNATTNQVNLFLYHITLEAAWRNQDLPRQARPGQLSLPPLALNLYYMLTAYGQDDNELIAQFLMGRAMRALHDHALLMPGEISDALSASEVQDQVERVRVTQQPLSVDDLSKLWMTFQTEYRTCAAYEASVVLIDSTLRRPAALPVRAANVYVSTFRRPVLDSISPQAVEAGGKLTINGQNLKDDTLKVRFASLPPVDPDSATDTELDVTLPAGLKAGVNTVKVVQQPTIGTPPVVHPGAGFESNVAAFVLAPNFTAPPPAAVAHGTTLTLDVAPPVDREQRAVVLLVEMANPPRTITIPAVPRPVVDPPVPANSLDFDIPDDLAPGDFLLRVQIDGADSFLEVDTTQGSPTFNQYIGPKVSIT